MNALREKLLNALGNSCSRDGYNRDPRILKLRTPVPRQGKGDSSYWSECTQLFETNPEGFEIICPNCLEIERMNKKQLKSSLPKLTPNSALWNKVVFSPVGFGSEHPWAAKLHKEGEIVLFLDPSTNLVHHYKQWDKPVATAEFLASYFGVDLALLTDSDECVTLERV